MFKEPLTQKWLDTGKGKICYFFEEKFKNRPTVILLHGLSSNHTTWNDIAPLIEQEQLNVLLVDLRGHGYSDKTKKRSNYNFAVFAQDIKEITEKEKINSAYLVGYSFGGQVAIEYASSCPETAKGLVLISVNYVNPLKYKHLVFFTPLFLAILETLAILLLWQKRSSYHYYQHGKAVGYWDSVYDGLRTMPLSVNFWMLAGEFRVNLIKKIAKINLPILITYGKSDAFITAREMQEIAKVTPGAKIIVSQNPDHFVGTNAQKETSQIILDFLNEHI